MRIAIVALGLTLAGCGSPAPDGYYSQPVGPTNALSMDIDTGAQLKSDPGKGVGVFAEYTAGGEWLVWTTCDTTSSGYLCGFDILASVKPTETLAVEDQTSDLEAPDQVVRVDQGAVRLVLQTGTDTDGVWLTAPAGEALELDVEWDGESAGSTLSWPRGGAVQIGAPSNPVELVPTTP
jgi:hypothetical protein